MSNFMDFPMMLRAAISGTPGMGGAHHDRANLSPEQGCSSGKTGRRFTGIFPHR